MVAGNDVMFSYGFLYVKGKEYGKVLLKAFVLSLCCLDKSVLAARISVFRVMAACARSAQ